MPISDGEIKGSMICSQAVVERVLGDESVTSLKIYNNIQSDNFVTGSAGWRIERNTGSVEFQDATIRGTLNASDITAGTMSANYISGGTIDASNVTVTNLNASNISTGTLSADRIAANSLAIGKISGGTYGNSDITFSSGSDLKSGNYSAGSAGWQIEGGGDAEFNDVTVRGTIYATNGEIGGLDIVNNITLNTGGVIRSDASGQRVEITSSSDDRVTFYSGLGAESTAGFIQSLGATYPQLAVWGPRETSDSGGVIYIMSKSNTNTIEIKSFEKPIKVQTTEAEVFIDGQGGGVRINGDTSDFTSTHCVTHLDGQSKFATGSASDPSITFNGDDGTGVYNPSSNNVGISAGGTNVATFLIESTDNATIQFDATDQMRYDRSANTFLWRIASTEEMRLESNKFEAKGQQIVFPNLTSTSNSPNIWWRSSDGRLFYQTSARRFKRNITSARWLEDAELRPVMFEDLDGSVHLGLVAEEVAATIPQSAVYGGDGLIENYADRAVLAALVAKVNRLEDTCLNKR